MNEKNNILIIAEAGVNHNGSFELAKKLVDIASDCKADMIKFQTFNADLCIVKDAEKAEYQKKSTGASETQYEMVKKLELTYNQYLDLSRYCKKKNIQFISTAFDLPSLDFLIKTINVPYIKIPSGDILNGPLLLEAAKSKKNLILSSGMCSLGDIETALGVLAYGYLNPSNIKPSINAFKDSYYSDEGRLYLRKYVTLLHCTTEYPTPYIDVNLRVINSLRNVFGLKVGLSDHSNGIEVPIAAASIGAKIIEKHFTIDTKMEGPDHKASLNPTELKAMVSSIRNIEKSLGDGIKVPRASEKKNIKIAKKSLVSKIKIKKGEVFTPKNLTFKRAGGGVDPVYYWEFLGKKASKNYNIDEVIDSQHK